VPQLDETLLYAICLSLVSGLGVFMNGVRGQKHKASIFDFIAECVNALTAGLVTFFLVKWLGWDESFLYAAILLCGNNAKEFLEVGGKKMTGMILNAKRGDSADGS